MTENEGRADQDAAARAGSPAGAAGPDAAPADDAGSADHGARTSRRGRLRGWASADPLRATSVAVTLVAAVCAAGFGGSWLAAASSASPAYSQARDAVLQAAEQDVVNLNTLDYRHARQDLALWLASSTAGLRSGLVQDMSQEVQVTEHDKLVTTASVLDGAVTQLDTGAGTANVMIALTFTVSFSGATPATKYESELGQLRLTSSGWKLSSLCPTSGCSSAGPGASPTPSPTP